MLCPRARGSNRKALLCHHTEGPAPSAPTSPEPAARVSIPSCQQRGKTLLEMTLFPQPARPTAAGDQDSACLTSLCPNGQPNLRDVLHLRKGLLLPTRSLPASWHCTFASIFTFPFLFSEHVLTFPIIWVSPPFWLALTHLPKSQPRAAGCQHQPTPGPRSLAAASPRPHDASLLLEPARHRALSQN